MKKLSFIIFAACALFSLQATKKNTELIFNLKALEKSLKLIPAGSSIAENEPGFLVAKVHTFKSFYMCDHEVTNIEYKVFLDDLKAKDKALYTKMLPDTNVRPRLLSFGEPYRVMYFRHPAYNPYPVIGITHEQAEEYCRWLTERYKSEEKRKYKKAEFRLPGSAEWEYASRGGVKYAAYPWGSAYLQNEKGQWLANFHVISQGDILRDTLTNMAEGDLLIIDMNKGPGVAVETPYGNGDNITPAISYFPNDYGLYNMAGNVEEFVSEKGITHVGSFYDTGYYLQNYVTEQYDSLSSASFERGFRFVMIVSE